MLLVVGGTGTVGSAVLAQLSEGGHEVRALVRSQDKAATVEATGAQAVVGDVSQPETLGPALDGVDRAFIVLPAGPDQVELESAFIRAVAERGSAGIVKLSVVGADPGAPVRFGASHGRIEQVLAESGVPHTVLRPNDFMQNSMAWAPGVREEGTVHTPNADAAIASVDARDIAAVAVAALTEDGHEGKVYDLSGPEALTRREQVARLAKALDRELEVDALTNEQARDGMLAAGYPEYAVAGLYELFVNVYDPGYAANVASGVEEATGRPARSWDEFFRDTADVWR